MRKYGIIAVVLLLVAVCTAFWLWMRRGNDSMASSLPKDASLIVRVDVKKVLSEYGITWVDITKAFFSGDNETGINPQQTGYFFAWNGYLGAILPLKDEDDFKAYLLAHSHTTQEQRGIKWCVVDNRHLVGYTEDRAVVMGPAVGAELDNLRNIIAQCLNQDEKESGMQSPLYARLQERPEPIALATDLQSLKALPMVGEVIQSYLKEEVDITAGVRVGKEKTTLSLALSSNDPKTNQLFDAMDASLLPLNGHLLKTAPKHPFFHMEMGVSGERLLELLRSIPEVRAKLLIANTIFDADLLLKNIAGDVSLSVPFINLFNKPSPVLQMELKEVSVVSDPAAWNDEFSQAAGVRFLPANAKQGRVDMRERPSLYYGIYENRLCLSESQPLAWATAYEDMGYAGDENLSDYRIYATLNLGNIMLFKGFADRSQQLTLKASDARQWQLDIATDAIGDIVKLLYK